MNIFNRYILSIFIVLVTISSLSYATGTEANIITEDKTNTPPMTNTLGATDIVNLSAYFTHSTYVINKYIIKSLPDDSLGTLYMSNGTTPVTKNQELTQSQADGLKFDPKESCSSADAKFTYVGLSDAGEEGTLGTITIPLVVGKGCSTTVTVTTDDKKNPEILNSAGATDILDLSGKDSTGANATSFIITSLPDSMGGILYMADGTTKVSKNQILTVKEANGLLFNPKDCFVGGVFFTYVAINDDGIHGNSALFTIPIVNGQKDNTPRTDDKNNPKMLNTLGVVNILDLSGTDSNGEAISTFIITSLPGKNQGILYMADGKTPVKLNQTLTLEQANGLKFDPNGGFVGDVTFTYVAVDDNGVQGNEATVTIPLIAPAKGNRPTADDKNNPKMPNNLGAVDILNLSGTDSNGEAINNFIITSIPTKNQGILYMADGKTPVKLNQTLTLEQANGLKFDPDIDFVGDVKFTYMAIDGNGLKSTNATVTIPVVALHNTDIISHDDVGTANGNADPIVINVLGNDDGTSDGVRVRLVNSDGTFTDEIVITGEGTWRVTRDNTIIFTPVAPFVGTPTPVEYVVRDSNGNISNTSTVRVTGECVCKPYKESIPIFSTWGLLLMMIFSTILGLSLLKREVIDS